jgi:hypothetical protein
MPGLVRNKGRGKATVVHVACFERQHSLVQGEAQGRDALTGEAGSPCAVCGYEILVYERVVSR